MIEILVVCAIVAVLISIILPRFSSIRENQVVKAAVADVLSAIDKARTETLSSLNSSPYGVHLESGRVIIFKGTVYSSSSPDNESVNIISPANISNVTLGGVSGASGDFYFNRLSGSPNKTGTVTVSSPAFTKIITISATGMASVN